MSDDRNENEWKRVSSNPHNLIVSDSLKGWLGDEFEDDEGEQRINVEIRTGENVYTCDILRYLRTPEETEIEFDIPRRELPSLMKSTSIDMISVDFGGEIENLVVIKQPRTDYSLEVCVKNNSSTNGSFSKPTRCCLIIKNNGVENE